MKYAAMTPYCIIYIIIYIWLYRVLCVYTQPHTWNFLIAHFLFKDESYNLGHVVGSKPCGFFKDAKCNTIAYIDSSDSVVSLLLYTSLY